MLQPSVSEHIRMYAITFDLDGSALQSHYHNSSINNAYSDIRKVLELRNFTWVQSTVYFGDTERVDAVSTVLAVQELAKTFPWFKPSVRDIRMLRIEDNNDLARAL